MARMTRRTKAEPVPQTLAVVGREMLGSYQKQNEEMVDTLVVGQGVQYYDEGWRYGKIETLPDSDEPEYGKVRIAGHRRWVAGRDVRPLTQEWEAYFKWKKI